MKKLVVFFATVLIFISCENLTKSKKNNNLEVRVKNDGYVILHSLDGKEVIEYKEVNSGETVVFEDLENSHVTFTIVNTNVSGVYWLSSYYEVPVTNYQIENLTINHESIGTVDLDISYPDPNGETDYTEKRMSLNGFIEDLENSNDIPVYNLYSNDKIKIFGYVWDEYAKYGYYNWVESDEFIKNGTNKFALDIDKPFKEKVITSNRDIKDVFINVVCDPYNDDVHYFNKRVSYANIRSDEITEKKHKVYYTDILDGDLYSVNLFNYLTDGSRYEMNVYCDELPDIIEIPSDEIEANYDVENEIILDVVCNGVGDFMLATWSYHNKVLTDSSENHMSWSSEIVTGWNIFTPKTYNNICRPEIPDEIILNEYNDLHLSCIVYDYSKINGYDDFFRTNSGLSSFPNVELGNYYRYSPATR